MTPINYKTFVPPLLFLLLGILSLLIIKPFLQALFLGALLAYVFYFLYKKILAKVQNKTVAALIVCVLVLVILIIPIGYFVKVLVQESSVLFITVKQKLAVGLISGCENNFCRSIELFTQDPQVNYHIKEISKTTTNWVIQKGSGFLFSIPRLVLNIFVVFFTMFYFLKEGGSLVEKLNRYLSIPRFGFMIKRLRELVHGIVYGYLVVALLQGALGALGFYLFGVSSPLFWGVVMGLFALIPLLGTGLVWVPASVVIILEGIFQDSNALIFKGIGLFVYCLIFVSTLDNVIRPKMVGEKAKAHPAIILLGTFGGLYMFGPLGVLIGPLVLAFMVVLINTYLGKEEKL